MVERKIKNLIELRALAFEQKEEGKTDLAKFLVNRTPRAIADIMQSTWQIEEVKAKLERAKRIRMELLQEARWSECAQGCNGDWLSCAKEILHNNGLSVEYFFLNPPLIFNTFCNPASGTSHGLGQKQLSVSFSMIFAGVHGTTYFCCWKAM
jgi:hypothetical protein